MLQINRSNFDKKIEIFIDMAKHKILYFVSVINISSVCFSEGVR